MSMMNLNVPPDNHVKVLGGQGWVGLIDHLGSEATTVNAARVSFGKLKTEMDERDVSASRTGRRGGTSCTASAPIPPAIMTAP